MPIITSNAGTVNVKASGVDNSTSSNITLDAASAKNGLQTDEFSLEGVSSIMLQTDTLTTVVGTQAITLEISCAGSGDSWSTTGVTVTPSGTAGVTVLSDTTGVGEGITAKRGRLVIASAITSGTFDIHVVGR